MGGLGRAGGRGLRVRGLLASTCMLGICSVSTQALGVCTGGVTCSVAVRVGSAVRCMLGVGGGRPNRSLTKRCSGSVRYDLHVRGILGLTLGSRSLYFRRYQKARRYERATEQAL